MALDLDILLTAANRKVGIIPDSSLDPNPAASCILGADRTYLLANRHLDLGRGSEIRFVVRFHLDRLVTFAIHASRSSTVGTGHHRLVRKRRVVHEDGRTGDVMQQDSDRNHHEIRFTQRNVALIIQPA